MSLFHNNPNEEGPPCTHMHAMLQDVADGNAKGIRRYYAILHAARCTRCGKFLDRTKLALAALRAQKSPVSQDILERIKAEAKKKETA